MPGKIFHRITDAEIALFYFFKKIMNKELEIIAETVSNPLGIRQKVDWSFFEPFGFHILVDSFQIPYSFLKCLQGWEVFCELLMEK